MAAGEFRSVSIDGRKILWLKIRKFREDFGFRHSAGEILEDVFDGDAQATNTRLA